MSTLKQAVNTCLFKLEQEERTLPSHALQNYQSCLTQAVQRKYTDCYAIPYTAKCPHGRVHKFPNGISSCCKKV